MKTAVVGIALLDIDIYVPASSCGSSAPAGRFGLVMMVCKFPLDACFLGSDTQIESVHSSLT